MIKVLHFRVFKLAFTSWVLTLGVLTPEIHASGALQPKPQTSEALGSECKDIRLAGPGNRSPYSQLEDGKLTGLGFTEAEFWFSKIGAKVLIQKPIWDEKDALNRLRRGELDGMVMGYNGSDFEDEDEFYISETWHRDGVHIFYHKDRPLDFRGINSLKNKVGVLDYSRDYGLDFERLKSFFLDLKYTGDRNLWIDHLESGKIDYFLLPLAEGLSFLKQSKMASNIEVSEKPIFTKPIHFIVQKNHPCVPGLKKIEPEMAQAVAENRVKNQILKELGPNLPPKNQKEGKPNEGGKEGEKKDSTAAENKSQKSKSSAH